MSGLRGLDIDCHQGGATSCPVLLHALRQYATINSNLELPLVKQATQCGSYVKREHTCITLSRAKRHKTVERDEVEGEEGEEGGPGPPARLFERERPGVGRLQGGM